jgi:CRISPR-associated protein Cas1
MSVTTDRILDISDGGYRLRAENRQLVLEKKDELPRTVPFEEIAVLLVSNSWVSYTHTVLTTLAECNGILVTCDSRSLPIAMSLPLQGYTLPMERLRQQVDASAPTQKRLWQQIVRAKVRSQAAILKELRGHDGGLENMLERVGSGDPENIEAQAARRYWPQVFGNPGFTRQPQNGEPPNHLLDYGYAVLRAMTARAIVGTGLNATFGIHHHNRANAFCLADDLMEPFRPLVDRQVAYLIELQGDAAPLNRDNKAAMIAPMMLRVRYADEWRTLFDVLSRIAANVAAVYADAEDRLYFPENITIQKAE